MTSHPSEYALDRAALGAATSEVSRHVARCGRCAAAIAARRAPVEPPAWLDRVEVRPERLRRRRWWLLPLPLVAATAAAVLAIVAAPVRERGVREKGAPRVTVFVKRGADVAPWDGRARVRAGDRLQLSIRGAGFAQASVASVAGSPAGVPAVLWAGPVEPDGETVLPLSFRVDAQGDREVLSVILSARPVAPWQHASAPRPDGGDWTTRLELPKEIAP